MNDRFIAEGVSSDGVCRLMVENGVTLEADEYWTGGDETRRSNGGNVNDVSKYYSNYPQLTRRFVLICIN